MIKKNDIFVEVGAFIVIAMAAIIIAADWKISEKKTDEAVRFVQVDMEQESDTSTFEETDLGQKEYRTISGEFVSQQRRAVIFREDLGETTVYEICFRRGVEEDRQLYYFPARVTPRSSYEGEDCIGRDVGGWFLTATSSAPGEIIVFSPTVDHVTLIQRGQIELVDLTTGERKLTNMPGEVFYDEITYTYPAAVDLGGYVAFVDSSIPAIEDEPSRRYAVDQSRLLLRKSDGEFVALQCDMSVIPAGFGNSYSSIEGDVTVMQCDDALVKIDLLSGETDELISCDESPCSYVPYRIRGGVLDFIDRRDSIVSLSIPLYNIPLSGGDINENEERIYLGF